jgi:hypothetical protein
MVDFFKRLFRFKRKVVMVDYDNRVAYFTTYDYPESGTLLLTDHNKSTILPIDQFSKNGDVYNLETIKGLYLLRYL